VPEISFGDISFSNVVLNSGNEGVTGNELIDKFTSIINWSINKIY
jgi:hypothetical protein